MTPVQHDCLGVIRRLSARGVPPSYEEIRAAMGLTSKSHVHRMITALERQGLLERDARRWRSIRLAADSYGRQALEQLSTERLGQIMDLAQSIVLDRKARAVE